MTMDERAVRVAMIVIPTAALVYSTIVLTQLADKPVAEVTWIVPMIWCMVSVIVITIATVIATAIGTAIKAEVRGEKAEFEDGDERDLEIERYAEHKTRWFNGLVSVTAIVLAMNSVDHFWIASTVYLIGSLGATTGSIVQIRAYRRGF